MLLPKVVRKQISYRKFQRVAKSPDSKKVRVFLHLEKYKIHTTIESWLGRDGYVYIHHGMLKPSGYRTYYFRYAHTEAVTIAGKDI